MCSVNSQWASASQSELPDTLQMLYAAVDGCAISSRAQQTGRDSFHHHFAEQNMFHKHRCLFALGSLSGRNPAVHFHICELLDCILSALWRCGDWGNNMLQAQEHGEKQYEKDSQKC